MTHTEITSTYRENFVRGASQVELVVLLYDLLLEDLRRAIRAIRARDIDARATEIKHALGVLEQLQGTLNFDEGGDTARNMDRLYSIVRAKLLEAHLKTSEEILQHQIDLLSPLRDAWQQLNQPAQPSPPADRTLSEWRV